MYYTLLFRFILTASVSLIYLAGVVSAQDATDNVRRNSPFSPNPKMKTAATVIPPKNDVTVDTRTGSVVSIEASNKTQKETAEIAQLQNVNFESRSAANKTLEVAKRAATAKALPTEIYRIGVGDVLFISLQNAPAKDSTYFTVLNNGTIDYPLANGMVSVAGLTTDEIETNLKAVIKLYENPQVSVNVREHNSHSYKVIGAVEKPGEKFIQREAVPLFVVRAEAVVKSGITGISIKRADATTETIAVNEQKYEDVLIYSGDIVEFISGVANEGGQTVAHQPQFYYIGGAIKLGGQKEFIKGLTLTQAILANGGLKKSKSQTVIIRRKNAAGLLLPTDYDLRAIKDGKIPDPELLAGDTIEIGN